MGFKFQQDVLTALVEKSRLAHYVYTPLLFHPAWREKIALVRCPAEIKSTASVPATVTVRFLLAFRSRCRLFFIY